MNTQQFKINGLKFFYIPSNNKILNEDTKIDRVIREIKERLSSHVPLTV